MPETLERWIHDPLVGTPAGRLIRLASATFEVTDTPVVGLRLLGQEPGIQ